MARLGFRLNCLEVSALEDLRFTTFNADRVTNGDKGLTREQYDALKEAEFWAGLTPEEAFELQYPDLAAEGCKPVIAPEDRRDDLTDPEFARELNLRSALMLAEKRYSVFPVRPDKTPFPGFRWREASTSDAAKIRSWWRQFPDAMPAIDCGKSRIVVIDADRHHEDQDGVAALFELIGDDPVQWCDPVIETAGGGLHVLFAQPLDGAPFGNQTGALPEGIDIRGAGGYIVAPGARLADGRTWRPMNGTPSPFFVGPGELGQLPKLLADLIRAPKARAEAPQPEGRHHTGERHEASKREIAAAKGLLKSLADKLAATGDGSRNIALNNTALAMGHEVAVGRISRAEVYEALLDACRRNGWLAQEGQRAFDATFRSGFEAGLLEPAGPLKDRLGNGTAAQRFESDDAANEPEHDIEAVKAELHAREKRAADSGDDRLADDLLHPDGVLGDMVDYIISTSDYPIREFAVASAIVTLGTTIGRRVSGPTYSGTHLYIAVVGPSGKGKRRPTSATGQILREISRDDNRFLSNLVGPGEIASAPALRAHLHDNPLSLTAFDEFGNTLSGMTSQKAQKHEKDISAILREAWGASFDFMGTKARVESHSSDAEIKWPAYSLIGGSNGEEFFGALSSKEATNGLLNRFIIFINETSPKSVRDLPGDKRIVPPAIVGRLLELHLHCMGSRDNPNLRDQVKDPSLFNEHNMIFIDWENEDVKNAFYELREAMDEKTDKANITAQLYARVAENAIRLATIHAVSRDGLRAKVTMRDFEWGKGITLFSARKLVKEAKYRISDNADHADVNRILHIIRNAGPNGITAKDLRQTIGGRISAYRYNGAMESITKGEMIYSNVEKRTDAKGGRAKTTYYINPKYDFED